MVRYVMYGMVWEWYGMMVLYDTVWYGMVQYRIVLYRIDATGLYLLILDYLVNIYYQLIMHLLFKVHLKLTFQNLISNLNLL